MVLDQAIEFIAIREAYAIRCLPLADRDANFKNLIIKSVLHFFSGVEFNFITLVNKSLAKL